MTENNDGTPAAEQAGTDTATAQQPTQPAADSAGRNAEDRIAGLIAENKRKDAQLTKEREARTELEEKYKSDEEKRIDEMVAQRVESEYGPYKQRLELIEAELTTKRDNLLNALPQESRNCYDPGAKIETQVRQIEIVAAHLSAQGTPPSSVSSGGNPAVQPRGDTRTYTRAEYEEVQRLAVSNPKEFDERWPEMKRALMEKRVEGVDPGRIAMR